MKTHRKRHDRPRSKTSPMVNCWTTMTKSSLGRVRMGGSMVEDGGAVPAASGLAGSGSSFDGR